MLACPSSTVELPNIFTVLTEAMIEDVQRQVRPFLLVAFDFIIILPSKFLQSRELFLKGGMSLRWRKICWLWRRRCWAARRHRRVRYHVACSPCHEPPWRGSCRNQFCFAHYSKKSADTTS